MNLIAVRPARRVRVYRNLNKPGVTYSIRDRKTNLVVGYTTDITLTDVTFTVGKKSREKVIATGRKNVHAFVNGEITAEKNLTGWRTAYYNPYKVTTFIDSETGEPLTSARYARIGPSGVQYI